MFLKFINILSLLASLILLASLSVEIIYSHEMEHFAGVYSWAMLVVCIIFIVDFFTLMYNSDHPIRFFARNFMMLILSIPYHFIVERAGITLDYKEIGRAHV